MMRCRNQRKMSSVIWLSSCGRGLRWRVVNKKCVMVTPTGLRWVRLSVKSTMFLLINKPAQYQIQTKLWCQAESVQIFQYWQNGFSGYRWDSVDYDVTSVEWITQNSRPGVQVDMSSPDQECHQAYHWRECFGSCRCHAVFKMLQCLGPTNERWLDVEGGGGRRGQWARLPWRHLKCFHKHFTVIFISILDNSLQMIRMRAQDHHLVMKMRWKRKMLMKSFARR